MRLKKISNSLIFNKITLVSVFVSPIIILSSCSSGSNESVLNTLENFLSNNQAIEIVDDDVKNFPAKIYFDNPETCDISFQVTDELKEVLKKIDATAEFSYSALIDNDALQFDIIFYKDGNEIKRAKSLVRGFITKSEYARISKNYLQSLNLNSSLKKQYELKEFLETKLPESGQFNEWNELLDFTVPPGYHIEFNNDLESFRYDSKNQKLVIGKFTSTISYSEKEEDLSVSITDNFVNPLKPLFVFVVSDNGIDASNLKDINAEVVFINRTTNNIFKLNQKLNNKAIYGSLNLESFEYWEIPPYDSGNNNIGVFQSNFITDVILPSKISEIPSRIFLENKILEFDTNNLITKIASDSFDYNVKYGLSITNQLGLRMYYSEQTKTLNFANRQEISTIESVIEWLQLFMRSEGVLEVKSIILPGELLTIHTKNEFISIFNELTVNVDRVEFVSEKKINIHDNLSLQSWKIKNIDINPEIISINIHSIKNANKNRVINRTLHEDIQKLVIDGVLDLREDSNIEKLLNYNINKKLNDYFDIGQPENNIIEVIYLENSQEISSSGFDKIFKKSDRNEIHISKETININEELITSINSLGEIKISRELPKNLDIVEGHLDLNNNSGVFIDDFFRNIIYLEGINEITLPREITEIPKAAFKNIDLSKIIVNYQKNEITKVGDYAFYKSNLQWKDLSLPNVVSIGDYAFSNNNLQSICLPNVITIGESAFQENYIKEIKNSDLPKVQDIKNFAFYKNNLLVINLPKVKNIYSNAFNYNDLQEIIFPNIERIEVHAFLNNANLKQVNLSPKTIISNKSFDKNVEIKINSDSQLLIPNLYVEDENGKTIDFNEVLRNNNTFTEAINQLNLQLSVESEIDYLIWNPDLSLENNETFEYSKIAKIKKLEIFKSDNQEIKIPNSLFYNIEIEEIIGLNNLTDIGDWAFYNSRIKTFDGLEGELIFDQNLKSIGMNSFAKNDIKNLTFKIGSTVLISSGSFIGNNNLVEINIPRTIEFVSSGAFDKSAWKYVKRVSYVDSKLPWEYDIETSEITFKRLVLGSQLISNNIMTLNGLKIERIKFSEDIYFIPESFLLNLMNAFEKQIEVDLSNILVVESKAFSQNSVKIKPNSDSNILYNDINSGI